MEKTPMHIAVIGLGLIGGSLVRALHARTDHLLWGFDRDETVEQRALDDGVLRGTVTDEVLAQCDLVLLALRPGAELDWLAANAARIPPTAIVLDCAGNKMEVCAAGEDLARQYGFTFVGGHPMAGMEKSGYVASREDLFDRASLILIPGDGYTEYVRELLEELARDIGFGMVKYTTAQEHDRTIAYTSQLAHIVSSAYIKSPTAQNYVGFSAGSFKDMTRVAFLNEPMWAELFLGNRDNLLREVREFQVHLRAYEAALEQGDFTELEALLRDGRMKKVLSDNRGI